MQKKPNIFLVGAPKCGSTALDNYLKQHPEVFMSDKKESHFFSMDFQGPLYIRDREEYLALFSDVGDSKVIGESSVYYLSSNKAPFAIKEFATDAKIIIMLRNPPEMLYSYHSQLLFSGIENVRDFRKALAAEADRRSGQKVPPNHIYSVNHLFYRDVVQYARQVETYFNLFGRENVHVILFDDLKANSLAVCRALFDFLDVDPNFEAIRGVTNPNANTRSAFLRRLLIYPGKYSRTLVKIMLPTSGLRSQVKKYLASVNTHITARPPMDATLRKQLAEEFASEVESLGKLLGRNLSC